MHGDPGPEFGLFFLSGGEAGKSGYELLFEAATFADANGFDSVWIPERHFKGFGAVYPNPSVVAAALAARTGQIQIRAGGLLLPLHSPIRVAEEWAMVDRLSGGRVGLAFAAGSRVEDFALRPENYAGRDVVLFRYAEMVERLWRGDSVILPGPQGHPVEVATQPRPLRRELPVWIQTSGHERFYLEAAQAGVAILVHAEREEREALARRIKLYRDAFGDWGHPGEPRVSLVVPTWITRDEVPPELLCVQHGLGELALIGNLDRCIDQAHALLELGVDELACLVDFGLPTERVLEGLPNLDRVRRAVQASEAPPLRASA